MRNPYFDNAKALLIFLVVLGHFIVLRGEVGEGFYWLIYSFHMPAFIFIAGYFAKKETWQKAITSSITQFILPYFIFQGLYNLYNYYLFDIPMNLEFQYANFALWFLLAMVYWKLTLQIIIRWKWTLVLLVLLVAVHRFFLPDLNYLDIGRAMTFSLFFYLGYFAKSWTPAIVRFTTRIPFASLSIPVFGIMGLVIAKFAYEKQWLPIERKWLFGTFDSFASLMEQHTFLALLGYQFGTALFSLMMVACFFMIVPRNTYSWTAIGGATLSIYLFHGFVRNLLVHGDYLFKADTWGEFAALTVLSFLVVYLFSTKPFQAFVAFTTNLGTKKQN